MEEKILQSESVQSRIQTLRDNCVRTEEMTYSRKFTPEEMIIQKDELSKQDLKLEREEAEKKRITAEFNERIKKIKLERSRILEGVCTGVEEVTEMVYLLDDQEEKRMGYYTSKGILVHERPLAPDENQLRITGKTIQLNGTNY